MSKWNPNETPDFPVIEDQYAEVQVDSMKDSEYQGRLTVDVETHIVDGAAGWNGFNVRTRFFLGTEEDPKAEQPQTRRSRNWTKYKNFLKACDVSPTGDTEEEAELVQNQTFLANIGHYSKKDAEGNIIRTYNTINSFHRVGSREVGLIERANGLDKSAGARDMKAEAERMVPRRETPSMLDDE